MKLGLSAFAAVLLLGSATASALTPTPPPYDHSIYSANRQFRAHISAGTKSTAVKEVRKYWLDPVRWRIPHYFEWVMVSNDGTFVITYGSLVPPPFSKEREVLWVYHRDGTQTTIPLGSLVRNLSRLESAMGMGHWGSAEIADGPWLRVITCEKRTLYVHARSGEVRVRMPSSPG